jgi:glycerophosphoryl diester phosphodiesterase
MSASKSFDLSHWQAQRGLPLIFGHRGARHAAPENTMPAFELALEEGAVGVEFDVRLDRDETVIVLHDVDLVRVTNGAESGYAESLGRSDFSRIDLGERARVPELAEVLSWAKQTGALLNVELKSDLSNRKVLVQRTARALNASGIPPEQVLVSSFHLPMLRAFAKSMPSIPTAWLFDRAWLGRAAVIAASGGVAVHPWSRLVTSDRVESWRRSASLINTWTVNDVGEALRLKALSVDAILTDMPRTIKQAVHSPR